MGSPSKSYSQRKREKMDYRDEYFKHNPGIFGCIWVCAYCKRPLVGKQNVQVDHIMPLNNVLGRNARYNLVAACPKCNHSKSDKVDGRVVTGYVSKGFEVVIFSIQKVIIIALVGCGLVLQKCWQALWSVVKMPFSRTSTTTKVVALVIYSVIGWWLYSWMRG